MNLPLIIMAVGYIAVMFVFLSSTGAVNNITKKILHHHDHDDNELGKDDEHDET